MKINWLYGKISLIPLLLLGVIGVMYLLITGYTTEKYLHASGQSLRSGTASIDDYLEKALANGDS